MVKEKERLIEVHNIEMQELHETCNRINKQLKEVEQHNSKLRSENEEINTNFRKMMRAQEHLHKDNSKKTLNKSEIK
jgi:hypothetical protein